MSGGAAGSAGRPTATPILHPPVPDLDLMGPCALAGSPTPRATPIPGPGREAVNGGGSRPARYPAARGHTPPGATVADHRPRGAAGQHPRPTLAPGATRCPTARGHAPPRHGRGLPAAWRSGATPPPHTGSDRAALPCGAGPRTPAPRSRIAGRVARRGSTPDPHWCRSRHSPATTGSSQAPG